MSKTLSHIDILIRILHIIIMVAFVGAYFTGDSEDLHQVHMMFGYILLMSITTRVIWHFLSPRISNTAPFGIKKRSSMAFNAIKKPFSHANSVSIFSKNSIQLISIGLFQASIVFIFILIPVVVALGYGTEHFTYSLRDLHSFFANLFLALVILHLSTLILNSILAKRFQGWTMLKMTWEDKKITKFMTLLVLVIVGAFSFVYLRM
ncbi:prokaryotic cytochrome b561 family protein [Acinetobacter sp. 1130196]|uniref:cytochrome b/b6 domain-containing protein n=1 Tax=Acinetobacter calcoaceticus/baumannii complex TaxID=909768 RepID=UPI00044D9C48|nr:MULTISPECIES: cytochrome b/b6 domain-containing protein [Acinetobacter calcoaceticus/baumannii complex]EKU6034106.1 cytochrome b/b6 domain-containing protein [Acinetobacter nosocomialis]EXR21102.1 prokaryotic cytochrome b561 family protein [Acinetobacter sp. 1130196]MBJ9960253.1 cytochrome b/b6 domain-containing protein [Acinetobacter nosocomialis]MBP1476269.1 cytochrome b/b6 domain-containing protein [Acinetobacter nosocomialis]MBP1512063.1 cytochrome b/b6 domain-containing protein [Acinet